MRLSAKQLNDLYDLRLAIEIFAMNKVAANIVEDDFNNLDNIIESQKNALAENDFPRYLEFDMKFHENLLKIADNELFVATINNLREKAFRMRREIRDNRGYVEQRISEHEQIVALLKNNDLKSAIKVMEKHLKTVSTNY